MGGAPPPPHDFAPQGPKNRRNSAPKRAVFERFGGAEDQIVTGGVGGIRPLPVNWSWWRPDAGRAHHVHLTRTGRRIRESDLAAV